MVKIIAQADVDATSLELVFVEPPEGFTELNLKNALYGAGFSIKERCPDGNVVIWECELPLGGIVTKGTIHTAKQAVKASGIQS